MAATSSKCVWNLAAISVEVSQRGRWVSTEQTSNERAVAATSTVATVQEESGARADARDRFLGDYAVPKLASHRPTRRRNFRPRPFQNTYRRPIRGNKLRERATRRQPCVYCELTARDKRGEAKKRRRPPTPPPRPAIDNGRAGEDARSTQCASRVCIGGGSPPAAGAAVAWR